jgi:hypothetical protein
MTGGLDHYAKLQTGRPALAIWSVKPLNGALCSLLVLAIFPAWNTKSRMTEASIRQKSQPTRAAPGVRYVGSRVCADCHPAESATQPLTDMARSLTRVQDCPVLRLHTRLAVRLGKYSYAIQMQGDRVAYTVTDGLRSLTVDLSFAFGVGHAGQTYVYEKEGSFFESRVSYFTEIDGLDLTLGYNPEEPSELEAALGRPMDRASAVRCFACHSTGAADADSLQLERMIPGVSCEGCHGPGSDHLAAVKSGDLRPSRVINPGALDPADLVEFCSFCHRSVSDVMDLRLTGDVTVRFQPYRLVLSRCYGTGGALSCLTCHDPHQAVRQDAAFYDAQCRACHAATNGAKEHAGHSAPACPVGTKNCVTCHMPKIELRGGHFKFTDHDIRVVRSAGN